MEKLSKHLHAELRLLEDTEVWSDESYVCLNPLTDGYIIFDRHKDIKERWWDKIYQGIPIYGEFSNFKIKGKAIAYLP